MCACYYFIFLKISRLSWGTYLVCGTFYLHRKNQCMFVGAFMLLSVRLYPFFWELLPFPCISLYLRCPYIDGLAHPYRDIIFFLVKLNRKLSHHKSYKTDAWEWLLSMFPITWRNLPSLWKNKIKLTWKEKGRENITGVW